MDRGYPSTAAFIRMMEKGILFLARLKSSDYKKEQYHHYQYSDKAKSGSVADRIGSFRCGSDVGFQGQYHGICLRYPAFRQ